MICRNVQTCYEDPSFKCDKKNQCLAHRDNRVNVTCEENRKRYNLINKKQFGTAMYHMDGGIIEDEPNVSKCDYLYEIKRFYKSNCHLH